MPTLTITLTDAEQRVLKTCIEIGTSNYEIVADDVDKGISLTKTMTQDKEDVEAFAALHKKFVGTDW